MWRRYGQMTSNAEVAIFEELCRRDMNSCMVTQHVMAFDPETEGVHGTIIDFFWGAPHLYAVFIDGPHHLKKRQENKDRLIYIALMSQGIRVDRFKYTPPLTKRRREEIVESIIKVLKGR